LLLVGLLSYYLAVRSTNFVSPLPVMFPELKVDSIQSKFFL
jgi:hypothetical protein